MEHKEVIAILKYYSTADRTIRLNNSIIKDIEDSYYNSLPGANMDGMPHGKGGISNPVEYAGMTAAMYAAGEKVGKLRQENEKIKQIEGAVFEALSRLNYHEKEIIIDFYVKNHQWERISQRLCYSPRQCRNIRNSALDRLGKLFSSNPVIKQYRFPEI